MHCVMSYIWHSISKTPRPRLCLAALTLLLLLLSLLLLLWRLQIEMGANNTTPHWAVWAEQPNWTQLTKLSWLSWVKQKLFQYCEREIEAEREKEVPSGERAQLHAHLRQPIGGKILLWSANQNGEWNKLLPLCARGPWQLTVFGGVLFVYFCQSVAKVLHKKVKDLATFFHLLKML